MNEKLEEIVARVIAELKRDGITPPDEATLVPVSTGNGVAASGDLVIDLPDPTVESERRRLPCVPKWISASALNPKRIQR